MEDVLVPIFVCGMLFVALPWIILHYVTRWKTAATLTNDDEALLEELYQLAKRLDDRMDTVERLVSADNPEFQPARILSDRASDNVPLDEIEQLRELNQLRGRK
ncbi:envelope stress response membrane protein PspB [Novosphingobium sp.]|uniref:envelope stress response membrane protein PspB n=1 Tax=Novosphingobium sp. TaxID=1874826 RepID=UPI0035B0190B